MGIIKQDDWDKKMAERDEQILKVAHGTSLKDIKAGKGE